MAKSIVKLGAILLIIVLICYIALFGLNLSNLHDSLNFPGILLTERDAEGNLQRNPNGIVLGLDLEGGSLIVFEADTPSPTVDQMDSAFAVIRARLDGMGFPEATVERQGNYQIRVEVPGMENPHEAVSLLGSVGLLTFVGGDGIEIMTGAYVDSAEARFDIANDRLGAQREWHIGFTLSEEGRQAFSQATARVSMLGADPETGMPRNYIAIVLDENIVSMPMVSQQLDTRELIITGNFDQEEARHLAGVINAGRLDVPLRHVELRSVSATLGVQALNTSVIAGLLGLLLIILFMLIFYKLPGLMASIALLGFVGIVGILLANFRINLTLPGIAGILLSVGMANDANILIFERLKEELKLGKTVRASVDSGFRRALPAIIDGEFTTLIIAITLVWLGQGPIFAFGQALAIGVVVSFFTAVVITRLLLNQMVGLGLKQEWLYGTKENKPSKGGDA